MYKFAKICAGQASKELFRFMIVVSFSTFESISLFLQVLYILHQLPLTKFPEPKQPIYLRVCHQGDQFISPFVWALENGSETICTAMLKDLLIIRADRAKYYYGAEDTELTHVGLFLLEIGGPVAVN